ncbi:MAG: hypothetical protein HYX60_09710 [Legionella longbeachae]|nr:hypothetical protein [Legionella longbeachae]
MAESKVDQELLRINPFVDESELIQGSYGKSVITLRVLWCIEMALNIAEKSENECIDRDEILTLRDHVNNMAYLGNGTLYSDVEQFLSKSEKEDLGRVLDLVWNDILRRKTPLHECAREVIGKLETIRNEVKTKLNHENKSASELFDQLQTDRDQLKQEIIAKNQRECGNRIMKINNQTELNGAIKSNYCEKSRLYNMTESQFNDEILNINKRIRNLKEFASDATTEKKDGLLDTESYNKIIKSIDKNLSQLNLFQVECEKQAKNFTDRIKACVQIQDSIFTRNIITSEIIAGRSNMTLLKMAEITQKGETVATQEKSFLASFFKVLKNIFAPNQMKLQNELNKAIIKGESEYQNLKRDESPKL